MQPENQQSPPIRPRAEQRSAEKIIQPLNPDLVAPPPTSFARPTQQQGETAAYEYDPAAMSAYRTASPHTPPEEDVPKRVSMQHKSLLLLSVVGLCGNVFQVYGAIRATAQLHTVAERGSSQAGLGLVYITIAINVAIFLYLLLARSAHSVATLMKVLLFFQVVGLFGIFFGGSAVDERTYLIEGVYLLFTYVVYLSIKPTR